MPPLLPEYLSQPVEIVVQSMPPTESLPIWISAMATLFGSFGGALLGGLVAYAGTKKLYREKERKENLKKIYLELFSLKRECNDLLYGIQLIAKKAGYKPSLAGKLHASSLQIKDKVLDSFAYLHVLQPEYDVLVNDFFIEGKGFDKAFVLMINEIDNNDKDKAAICAEKASENLRSAITVLKKITISISKNLRSPV